MLEGRSQVSQLRESRSDRSAPAVTSPRVPFMALPGTPTTNLTPRVRHIQDVHEPAMGR